MRITDSVESLGQPVGERRSLAKQGSKQTENFEQLLGIVCDESDFKKGKASKSEPVEDLVTINIYPTNMSKTARIGALLQGKKKAQFKNFLKHNLDAFTWLHNEMPGIEAEMMVHHLNVDPDFKSIQQKR